MAIEKEATHETVPVSEDRVLVHGQTADTGSIDRLVERMPKEFGIAGSSSLTEALQNVVLTDSQSGQMLAIAMAGGWANEMRMEIAALKARNSELAKENKDQQREFAKDTKLLSDEITALKVANSDLRSGITERKKLRPMVTFGLSLGPVLAGFGVDKYSTAPALAVPLALVGVIMYVLAWRTQTKIEGGE